ncbi:hypothetical protein PHYSODRAFT_471902 [Phytophthora sojae]|uniref:Uncharacterized protein n=1 Tax=Phytophthora sojae (strain P6497) TaxID=1094619 RepID=G4YK56_PHYSP|nr:hypothetical protein PHYSODRAFT_471902 [Phytophthora sojae]EGZ27818.1 hypothetical protein PHYSODRAFT_471902 [Phytophthora sojae]|eukprot:XP_009515093.1 hypothetical protein PHYSODRAFT_471902 [Phytophthora sojae]
MSWKKVEFKGSDSVDRLQRIQALCPSSDTKLDGILIIGGVDSFHSQASQAAIKYLFLGSSGQELLGEQVILQEHERLEDVILLICPQRVSIFYSSESDAAVKVLPVISKWRHVTEYVVHDGMEPDEQEERKISAFKSMMAGVKTVGVPFGVDREGTDLQDSMIPEKWPLVQSYGLEGGESTAQGFFTMNHRVVNVSREMMDIMAQLDGFSAKRVVQESQPFLAHHFDEFLLKMDHAESPDVRNAKSESDLGEDLLSFYEFGTMQYSARGLKIGPNRGSRVLFGARTSSLTEKSSSKAFLSNTGVKEGVPATHMVVQAEDPFTGVRFARTYFLSSGKVCKKVVDEDALVRSPVKPKSDVATSAADTKTMIDMYALLLRGKFPTKFIDDQLRLTAEIMDACGQPVDSLTEDWCLLYCSMKLANIPSDANPSLPLGSLVAGDTFLFHGPGAGSLSSPAIKHVLHVTKPFANFRSWIQSGEEADAVDDLMRTLQSEFMLQSRSVRLGKAITPLDSDIEENGEGSTTQATMSSKATLLLNSDLMPIVHGGWRVFTGGMVFASPYFNPIVVSIERNVKSLTILPSPHEELVLLKMELKDNDHTPLSEALPSSLASQELFIPLQSGTRFQDEVFRALESWKVTAASLNVPIFRASDLSEQFDAETPRDREVANFEVPVHVKATCELLVQRQTFVGQDARTIDDFFPQDFIPKDPGAATTLPKPNTDDLSRLCIPVTVMLGIPGSGVAAMADSICKISSASFVWATVDVDLRNLDPSKQQKMEASGFFEISDKLSRALDRIKADAKTLSLHPRIMLTVVGYVDPITVACAIRRGVHDSSLSSKIGAVINCVSANNVYLPDPLATQAPFPKVFDQMEAGFVTHLVLTNSADIEPAVLQRLRFHMDHVNPFADVMVLSHDVFEGPLTPLLAIDRFESAYYKQYRNAHFPDWESSSSSNNAAPIYTRYVAELENEQAPVSFRFEIVPGMDRSKFSFLIARTMTPFATLTKSMDRVYPMDNAGNKSTKGIRIAQTIAVEKVANSSTGSSATPSVEGVFSNGQSRSCWCVEGQVVFKDEPGCVYEYRSTGTFARLWADSSQLNNKADSLPSLEMKVTGQGLNADKLREMLLNCYAHAEASPNQVRSKASISLEEKREIQRQHAMDPLPEGYLFDGTNYVDFFGGRYEFHPCIAQFIDEYVTAANDDRKATNIKATAERESQQSFVRQIV